MNTEDEITLCRDCPRDCGVERNSEKGSGFCKMPLCARVARAAPHFFEEPCISGTKGSGAVFFSGCSLRCIFCQNESISAGGAGKNITTDRLREIYAELCENGVHNINLVNPTHFVRSISDSLSPRPPVPVVYNSGGYDRVDSLKLLDGKIQIYLPDLKYSDDNAAKKYSGASDYFGSATAAIKEMYRQRGKYVIDSEGIMQSGVIIRHLMLPDNLENTLGVIDWVADNFRRGEVKFSLMSQYTPIREYHYPELNHRISHEEYDRAVNYMYLRGLTDGYIQDPDSADDTYIPDFDLTGI